MTRLILAIVHVVLAQRAVVFTRLATEAMLDGRRDEAWRLLAAAERYAGIRT